MPIEDRNLKPGTKLVGRYHKQSYTCEVVEVEGKLRYRLEDGREFKTPSGAGMAVTLHACDGWHFWSVAKDDAAHTAAVQPAVMQPTETRAEPTAPAEKPTPFYKLPNQKGAPEGQVKWYCRECKKSFLAPTVTTPEACPQGHRAG